MANWKDAGEPLGYFGKQRDLIQAGWDEKYGIDGWRLVWKMGNGEIFTLVEVIYKLYIPGYVKYFSEHSEEARWITDNFAYGYDKTPIDMEIAFKPMALVNQPGLPNQFHHAAFNIALIRLGYEFKGEIPLQVREGRPGTPEDQQPEGWKWSPGYIPVADDTLAPEVILEGWWALPNSIEAVYQSTKCLQTLFDW